MCITDENKRAALCNKSGQVERYRVFRQFRVLCVPILLIGGAAQAGAPSTPDANAIARKMVAVYKSMQSYQETSEAKILLASGKQYYQTSTVKYKQPDKMVITSQDPASGSQETYNNGLTLTFYSGKQNVFMKFNALKTLAKSVTEMEKINPDVLQLLSPASFVAAKTMPREVDSFKFGGVKEVEGHKTYRILGQASLAWMRKMRPEKNFAPSARDIILYVDTNTNLLIRSVARLTWKVTVPAQGRIPAKVGEAGYALEEVHRNQVVNPQLADNAFFFSPPKNATEIFRETK